MVQASVLSEKLKLRSQTGTTGAAATAFKTTYGASDAPWYMYLFGLENVGIYNMLKDMKTDEFAETQRQLSEGLGVASRETQSQLRTMSSTWEGYGSSFEAFANEVELAVREINEALLTGRGTLEELSGKEKGDVGKGVSEALKFLAKYQAKLAEIATELEIGLIAETILVHIAITRRGLGVGIGKGFSST